MKKVSTDKARIVEFRQGLLEQLRARIREAIQVTLEEELSEALGCGHYERDGERRGYPQRQPEAYTDDGADRGPGLRPVPCQPKAA